jgi:hypothetical protein
LGFIIRWRGAYVSPFRSQPDPAFPLLAELLRFFDQYVLGIDTGLADEDPVHLLHDGRGALARGGALAAA